MRAQPALATMACMKKLFVTWTVAAAMLAGCATPYAPQQFGFSELHSLGAAALGVVESVQEVALANERPHLVDVFEHAVQPAKGDRLVIRLDSGQAITVLQTGLQRFEAGRRVRVLSGIAGTQVEYE